MSGQIRIGTHEIEITNPDKFIFPQDGITKEDLVHYYERIADTMLPHIRDRIISMERYPEGIMEDGFYQKRIPDSFPDWIERTPVDIREEGGRQWQVVIRDKATLVYIADQACITPHVWLSRVDRIQRPDRLVFDLDPSDEGFESVRDGSGMIRNILEELELVPFVMTTGSQGLHVVVPIERNVSFEDSRAFARDVARLMSVRYPEQVTDQIRKSKRGGRLFIDYLRNSFGQTTVAPYAMRPHPGAPVATPIDWRELEDFELTSQAYTISNIFRRLGQKSDPWKDIRKSQRSLTKARPLLDAMMGEVQIE